MTEVIDYADAGAALMLSLTARIFADAPRRLPVPAVYVFGQTPDNEGSVIEAAAALVSEDVAERLLIPESEPWGGYGGHAHWRCELQSRGVASGRIITVPTSEFHNLNTLTEALSVAKVAAFAGWNDLLILAAPFHLVRAFITTATVMIRNLPGLDVYAAAGAPQPWLEAAVHSQGTLRERRTDLLSCEFDRLVRYHRQGDLLGPAEILAYLDRRDAADGRRG